MKVRFKVKYGWNEIDIPIEQCASHPQNQVVGFQDKFTHKVTIYNDIPADGVNLRRFGRFVIDRCLIYNQLSEKANGTINKVVNSQNVVTKDVEHYKSPLEYRLLAADEREDYFTVSPNDFVVFGEVDDIVTDSAEFQALQKKYKNNGFLVTAVNASVFGMNVDNVHIMHA